MWDAIWNDETIDRDDEMEWEIIEDDDDADGDDADPADAVELSLEEFLDTL